MEAIYNIIYNRYDLKKEIAKLLSRPLKEEKI